MSAENKAIIDRLNKELWTEGNLAVVDELFTTNFVNHDPGAPEVRTIEEFKQWANTTFTAFPDFQATTEDLVAEGDKVAERWTVRGTHKEAFGDIAATGKQITLPGMCHYRIAGGKIAECWWCYDNLSLLQQLGVIPPPEQGES